MPSSHLILCRPLLLLSSIPPSIRVFSNESALHMRWPKHWSFSFRIIPSKNTQDRSPLEWTGWISLQSKGLSRNLLQHHSSKASILRRSAFFTVQISHPYRITGKTIVSRGPLGIWGEIFDFPTRGRVPGHSGLNPRMQVSKLQSTGHALPQGSIHPMSTVVKLRNMVLHKTFSQNQCVYESLGNLIIKYRF